MLKKISLKARAKINLTLDVTGKRDDGYHLVEMIMQQVDLYDIVTLERNGTGDITLTSNVPYLPTDSMNIAYKAADLMKATYGISDGISINIRKNIPVAAGLAGGSTNAAAVIVGMNMMFELGLSTDSMMKLGLSLGADVPFCIKGGAAIARGIGEELEEIDGLRDFWILLSKPPIGVSTKEVYGGLSLDRISRHPDTSGMAAAISAGDLAAVSSGLCNVLEEVTTQKYPVVNSLKAKFREYGARGVLMSGSGPTVFGIFKDKSKAVNAYENLARYYKQTFLVKSYGGGWETC